MNRDTFGGAVHGLGKRGTGGGIADHGRAGDIRVFPLLGDYVAHHASPRTNER